MKGKFIGLVFLLFFYTGANIYGQNEKIKTLFILNFIKNINWHSDIKIKSFNVLVIGNKLIANELNNIGQIKQSGVGSLIATYSKDVIDTELFDIIYIEKGNETILNQINQIYNGKTVLIITENCDGCKHGAGINMIDQNGKLSYEIHKTNIESRNLGVTIKLLNLGKQVD